MIHWLGKETTTLSYKLHFKGGWICTYFLYGFLYLATKLHRDSCEVFHQDSDFYYSQEPMERQSMGMQAPIPNSSSIDIVELTLKSTILKCYKFEWKVSCFLRDFDYVSFIWNFRYIPVVKVFGMCWLHWVHYSNHYRNHIVEFLMDWTSFFFSTCEYTEKWKKKWTSFISDQMKYINNPIIQ